MSHAYLYINIYKIPDNNFPDYEYVCYYQNLIPVIKKNYYNIITKEIHINYYRLHKG